MGKQWKQWQTLFSWAPKSLWTVTTAVKLKGACSWKKSYDQHRQHIKKQRHYFANKGPSSQSYDFSSSHVWMWELEYKESWALKNWCLWTAALEKTLESPLDCKEFKPVHPKGNQSWILTGRTKAGAETPILWPPDADSWLIGKHPDAGKDWRQGEEEMTEDKLVGWHHRLDVHEFEEAPGVGEWQGSLVLQSMVTRRQTQLSEWTDYGEKHNQKSAADGSMRPLLRWSTTLVRLGLRELLKVKTLTAELRIICSKWGCFVNILQIPEVFWQEVLAGSCLLEGTFDLRPVEVRGRSRYVFRKM